MASSEDISFSYLKSFCCSAWRQSSRCFFLDISKPFNSSLMFILQILVTSLLCLLFVLSDFVVHTPNQFLPYLGWPLLRPWQIRTQLAVTFLDFVFQVFWPLVKYNCMALYSWPPYLSIYVAYTLMGHIQTGCLGETDSAGLALLLITVTLLLGSEGKSDTFPSQEWQNTLPKKTRLNNDTFLYCVYLFLLTKGNHIAKPKVKEQGHICPSSLPGEL